MLKIGTDFSGLGSPEEAFKRLGVNHENMFACEIDKYAQLSYLANHETSIMYEDITKRNNENTPYVDIYVYGFPCQSFSISGKRLGFEDTRGTLFFSSLEYIKLKKPRVFIAENVKGLLSHDKPKNSKAKYGRTFGVIRDALAFTINGQHNLYKYDDCVNYHVFFQVLNTKDYGLPQNRERIFIVGFGDEEDALRFKFPAKIPLKLKLKDLLEKDVPEKYYLSEAAINRLLKRGDDLESEKELANAILTGNNQTNLSFKNSATLVQEEFELANPRTRLAKSTDSISPCIMANQAKQSTDSILIHEIDDQLKNQVIVDNDNGILREVNVSTTIDSNYGKGMDNHGQRALIVESDDWVQGGLQDNQHPMTDGICPTLTSAMGMGSGQIPIVKVEDDSILFVKENTARGYTEAREGDSVNLSNPNSTTRRGRVGKQVAQTLDTACNQGVLIPLFDTEKNPQGARVYDEEGIATTQSSQGDGMGAKTGLYKIGMRIRRLTPRECFRLQGYDDSFFDKCQAINSDTQLYKQAGNSISVHVFVKLSIQILKALKIPFQDA